MAGSNAVYVAGGNIAPSRFVRTDTTADNRVVQATAGTDVCVGVSQVSKRRPPYGSLDDGFAAIAGEGIRIYQLSEVAPIEIGAAVVRGARLVSDANGRAVTATANQGSYAIALQSGGASGVIIDAQIVFDTGIGAS
jgi:hypothetical protein